MPGLKKHEPSFRFNSNKVTLDEINKREQYIVSDPGYSSSYIGTAAGGTSTQAKALVLINAAMDYPRNVLYSCVGTADIGGTWTINGTDQFGVSVTETVGSGTAAAGTPAFGIAGTQIFDTVTSGTFTVAGVGAGSAAIGQCIGTGATDKCWFGLPGKLGALADVKTITWTDEDAQTTLSGGTLATAVHINTTTHAFGGTETVEGTQTYVVSFLSTYNSEYDDNVV